MDLNYLIKNYEPTPRTLNINYIKIKCHQLDLTDAGIDEFNKILEFVESLNLKPITRTYSHGISTSGKYKYHDRYDVIELASMIELTLLIGPYAWRIQLRNKTERMGSNAMPGRLAFYKFREICETYGINIEDYKITQGPLIKNTITPYIKKLLIPDIIGLDVDNVNHIDFNSSFMANLCEAYPEFQPVGDYLYTNRKEHPEYKAVMNCVIGYFQSLYHDASWAHLSKAAINGNNTKVLNLCDELVLNGRKPILINTDGIWYQGEVYHNDNEGTGLGQWKTDHQDCKLLVKSDAVYQYLENGQVKTVQSGLTNLDKVKPRSQWEWGDIFKNEATPNTYKFINNRVVKVNED